MHVNALLLRSPGKQESVDAHIEEQHTQKCMQLAFAVANKS